MMRPLIGGTIGSSLAHQHQRRRLDALQPGQLVQPSVAINW